MIAHPLADYYMDIVQDLRREILSDADAEQVFASGKRPYLQGLSFEALKKKGNHEQELVDLQIKTFACTHAQRLRPRASARRGSGLGL